MGGISLQLASTCVAGVVSQLATRSEIHTHCNSGLNRDDGEFAYEQGALLFLCLRGGGVEAGAWSMSGRNDMCLKLLQPACRVCVCVCSLSSLSQG